LTYGRKKGDGIVEVLISKRKRNRKKKRGNQKQKVARNQIYKSTVPGDKSNRAKES